MTRKRSTRSARPGSRPPRGRVPGSFGSLLSFRIDAELSQQPVPQFGEPGVVPVARAGKVHRPAEDDPATGQDQNSVGEVERLIPVVRDQELGGPMAFPLPL